MEGIGFTIFALVNLVKTLGFSLCYNYMHLLIAFFILLSINQSKPKIPKDFQWKKRILILNTYKIDSQWFDDTLAAEVENRKLIIFHFMDGKLINTNFPKEIDSFKFFEILKDKAESKSAWALIGLDGGVKNSGCEMPLPKEIFKLIDSMPMRQSEIKNSKK